MAAPRRSRKPANKAKQFDTFNFEGTEKCVVMVCKDSFLRSHCTTAVVEKLEAVHGEIDRFEFDGESDSAGDVLEELRAVGLLHNHKLVVLDKADRFVVNKGDEDSGKKSKGPSRSRQLLEKYAQDPSEGATLLLRTETWRGGNLDNHMTVFRLGVEDEHQAAGWCLKRCIKVYETEIELEAAQLLVSRGGMDLGRLDGELAKLATLSQSGSAISIREVREAVGASREEEGWAIKAAVILDGPEGSLQTIREIFDLSRDRQDVPAFWAITELLRALHSASSLLKQGQSPGQAQRAAGIFDRKGERQTANRIMQIAQRMGPTEAARRLQEALAIQADLRRGIGTPKHALEGLTVILADRVRELCPR